MPITNDFEVNFKEGGSYTPLPKDVYQAEIVDIDVDTRENKDKKEETFFVITYGILDQGEFRARRVWDNWMTTYLYIGQKGKNKLFKFIEASLRRELTKEEISSFTAIKMNKLIGQQLRLNIEIQNEKYNKITDWLAAKSPLPELTQDEKEPKQEKEESTTTDAPNFGNDEEVPF